MYLAKVSFILQLVRYIPTYLRIVFEHTKCINALFWINICLFVAKKEPLSLHICLDGKVKSFKNALFIRLIFLEFLPQQITLKGLYLSTICFKNHFIVTTYRGRNPNDHVFASTVCSAYNEHTWWCNMSYERKFCQLSEYVQVQKVGSLIKSTHVFKWNSADFDKFVNSQKLVNFRPFSLIWKLPWPMAITMPTI